MLKNNLVIKYFKINSNRNKVLRRKKEMLIDIVVLNYFFIVYCFVFLKDKIINFMIFKID